MANLAQSEQSAASELEDLCIASHQPPEDASVADQYQKFEDLFEHSPLDLDQIRLLSLSPSGGRGPLRNRKRRPHFSNGTV